MLRDYLTAALRNLVRNKFYAAMNIAGLAVGFTAALLIVLFVRDEVSYDTWIPGHENAYLVTAVVTEPGRAPSVVDFVPAEFASWMSLDFPAIEDIARITAARGSARRGDVEASERIHWADPAFFKIIRLPAVAGRLEEALAAPDGLVITRRTARKYFGRDDPIGETLELNRRNVMRVLAVIEDLPSNTHLNFDLVASGLASFSDLAAADASPQAEGSFLAGAATYFSLKPGAAIGDIQDAMPEFFRRHKRAAADNAEGTTYQFPLVAIADIHLSPAAAFSMKPRGDRPAIYAVSAVGLLILLIAAMNFVNLMTARAPRRAVEIGVRKVEGAERAHLALQFIGESLVYVVGGLALATAFAAALVPGMNAFLQRDIRFDLWRDAATFAGIIGGAFALAVLAGAYPAFVISSFRPAAVLRAGKMLSRTSSVLRQVLVVLQFAILIALAMATGVIYRQTDFAVTDGLRLDADRMLAVFSSCRDEFREAVARLPDVRGTACSSGRVLNIGELIAPVRAAGGAVVNTAHIPVEAGFLELYGFRPLAGRFPDEDRMADATAGGRARTVVLNETAVRQLGLGTAARAVGMTVNLGGGSGPAEPAEVIGVVGDFAAESVRRRIPPTLYYVEPRGFDLLHIKLDGQRIPEGLAAIDQLWKQLGEPRAISRFFVEERLQAQYADIVRQSRILAIFAAISILIACLGLFGLSAFIAEARTKEIGIRKVMGASRADILRLMLWQFTKPVLWANLIAWPVAYIIMQRWLEGFAAHIDLEIWMFLAASALAVLIAVATVSGHALLAAHTRLATALRYE